MQIPLQITVRDLAHSETLAARIRGKAAKLQEFHPRIFAELAAGAEVQFIEEMAAEGPQAKRVGVGKQRAST